MAQSDFACSLCGSGKMFVMSSDMNSTTTTTNNNTNTNITNADDSFQFISTSCDELFGLESTLNETECQGVAPFFQAGCPCVTIAGAPTASPVAQQQQEQDDTTPTTTTTTDENEAAVSPTGSPTVEEAPACVATNDSETLRNTCKVYGLIFLILFLVFCMLRRRYPQTYAVRSWDAHPSPTALANPEYSLLGWISQVLKISDDDLQDECGMDGTCLVRINWFGLKLCAVCMVNAIWLIPVYATSKLAEDTECIVDSMQSITISNVPSGSGRLIASTIASYIIFGYTMYSILGELEWWKRYRHRFLAKQTARNHSIYVRCIAPEEYLSDAKLVEFFNKLNNSTTADAICVEAHVARKIPNLTKKVAERDALVANLEHAINVKEDTGVGPMHSTKLCGGEKVDSIETYTQELETLNQEIKEALEKLAAQNGALQTKGSSLMSDMEKEETSIPATAAPSADATEETPASFLGGKAAAMTNLLSGQDDGEHLTAAFVSFRSLQAANAAIQMDHSETPHAMEAFEAPDPDDVLWANVGKTHSQLQIGRLLSLALTTLICLFWTVVIAFAASLSSVEGLREIKFINDMLNVSPWLEPVFAQLAPFIVVIVNALLKTILTVFSSFELPVSIATLEASLFTKLAWFMIIQNFFVASIGGASAAAYTELIEDPTAIIGLLATSLPAQSTFHIQILLVNVFLSMGLELLGVSRLAVAWIRRSFGPGLTEKERRSDWMGLKPINNPDPFIHSLYTAWNVLYFLVILVYATIAPISSFFMALCFLIMGVCFRYVLIYIYPVTPDSGGKLFVSLLRIILVCLVIAELTVLGLLGLKESAIAATLMIPLLVVTVLFNIYVKQKHFSVAEHLPSGKCLAADEERNADGFDPSFLQDAYLHPDLKAKKTLLPDNIPGSPAAERDEEAPDDLLLVPEEAGTVPKRG
eukprot:CAMPEP_0117082154 /NCGR_PEP_ID=MMETSP0472-20121206/57867_1 /TAXON_ID=693140 ORGANISM="Tiarina fusus, Strain LIS" /NCGR_SAMPLE_ID=MMETSP0472 /ASSEMBLY_ACC=CAM_ASM_000603 /LENGTH=929 /DNA_ID=CAMNT_0004810305 /DNA_START=7 /DNA_END=2796 /DNA_ORIENTATION=+